jgi:hypothetical protein
MRDGEMWRVTANGLGGRGCGCVDEKNRKQTLVRSGRRGSGFGLNWEGFWTWLGVLFG